MFLLFLLVVHQKRRRLECAPWCSSGTTTATAHITMNSTHSSSDVRSGKVRMSRKMVLCGGIETYSWNGHEQKQKACRNGTCVNVMIQNPVSITSPS